MVNYVYPSKIKGPEKHFAGYIEANLFIYGSGPAEGLFGRTTKMGKEVEACER